MYSRGKTITKLVYGLDQLSCQTRVGDILISAKRNDAFNGRSFVQNLNKFKKLLRKLLPKGVSVVTRSDSGRMHCHIAVEMPTPALDFDWISFEQSEVYYKLYSQYKGKKDLKFFRYFTTKYRRSLPKEWRLINERLMIEGKRFGLGRVFLTPIRKNCAAYKWYLVSNVPYKRDSRDIGVEYFTSWGLKCTAGLQLVNKFTKSYRDKLKRFAEGLQLTSENYNISLRSVLGPSWYYKCKDLIKNMDKLSSEQSAQYNDLRQTIATDILRSS